MHEIEAALAEHAFEHLFIECLGWDRLRVGNYRVLFEVDGNMIVVYRILHRKDAYQ